PSRGRRSDCVGPAPGAVFLLSLHDALPIFEGVRLVGVAVVPVQGPVQRGRTGRADGQQQQAAIIAHDATPTNHSARPSRKVPTVSAASSSFHCCTGTLPMVSPVRPLTAM